MNEFKFSGLRQFGSENISFTSVIHSDSKTLTDEEINDQIAQFTKVISKAFVEVTEREISEKEVLIQTSERRRDAVARHDQALKNEMATSTAAKKTMQEAQRLSDKEQKRK